MQFFSTDLVTKVLLGNARTREAPASQNPAFGKRFRIAPLLIFSTSLRYGRDDNPFFEYNLESGSWRGLVSREGCEAGASQGQCVPTLEHGNER